MPLNKLFMTLFITRFLPIGVALLGNASLVRAQAVVTLSPRLGATLAAASYQGSSDNMAGTYHTSAKLGGEAGLMASVRWGHFAVQPALLYAQRRYKLADDHVEDHGIILHYLSASDYYFNYLTLPLNLAYSCQQDGQGFQGFAGGYVSRLLGGQVAGNGAVQVTNVAGIPPTSYTVDQDIQANDEYDRLNDHFHSKRYDAGVQAGVGYQRDRFLVQVAYSLGLVNVGARATDNTHSPTYYNRATQLYLTYNLFPTN
jgi:hypothetical protein